MVTRQRQAQARKRIRRRPEDAEREILAAAEAFLKDHEFRELSVDRVMAGTGMVRSTFYNYFPDRYALILRLTQELEREMMVGLQPWIEEAGDPAQNLRAGLEQVVQVAARHGHLVRAVHEAAFHDADVGRVYWNLLDNFIDVVETRIKRENRAGVTSVPRPREVAHALLQMNSNVLVQRLGRPQPDSPRDVADTLMFIWERVLYGRTAP